MTVGKNFSSPSKPDQAKISSFIRLQIANPGTKDFFARLTIVPRKEGLEVVFFPYIFFYPVFFS